MSFISSQMILTEVVSGQQFETLCGGVARTRSQTILCRTECTPVVEKPSPFFPTRGKHKIGVCLHPIGHGLLSEKKCFSSSEVDSVEDGEESCQLSRGDELFHKWRFQFVLSDAYMILSRKAF